MAFTLRSFNLRRSLVNVAIIPLVTFHAMADDWPHWLGPTRNSVWNESDIITKIPQTGLKKRWSAPIELGYSGPSVADGMVYVMDLVKASGEIANKASWRDVLEGKERILCFDASSGKLLWEHTYPISYEMSYGGGPRCTPTVSDGKVYALGAEGNLNCLNAKTGTPIWRVSFKEDFGATTPIWGFAAHPYVDGERLYCMVGGENRAVVAFDKNSGAVVWKALSAPEPGYCPPSIIEHGGVRQLIVWHPQAVNSLNPQTGEVYWSETLSALYGLSVIVPRLHKNWLFVSSQNNTGFMLELDEQGPNASVLWRLEPGNGASTVAATSLFTDKAIYACDVQSSSLIAFDPSNGERFWQTKEPVVGIEGKGRHGAAFIVRHQQSDRYFILSETGYLHLAEMTPESYNEIGRFKAIDPTKTAMGRSFVWSHPAFANQNIYLRNDKELICYDLSNGAYATN